VRYSASFNRDEVTLLDELLRLAARTPDLAQLVRSKDYARLARKARKMREIVNGQRVVDHIGARKRREERDRAIVEECRAAQAAGQPWSVKAAAELHGVSKQVVAWVTRDVRLARKAASLTAEQMDDLARIRLMLLDAGEWLGVRTMASLLAPRYGQSQAVVVHALAVVARRPRPRVGPTLAANFAAARALLRELMPERYAAADKEAAE